MIDERVEEFLGKVYEWLDKPMNRSVEDYHYDCYELNGRFKAVHEIGNFLIGRYVQMYEKEPTNKFIEKATYRYLDNMFS